MHQYGFSVLRLLELSRRLFWASFPVCHYSKARKEVVGLRADILRGINPANEKRETKRKTAAKAIADQSAQTVTELVNEYFRRNVEGKCKTAKAMRQRVDKYLIPVIGKLRIDVVEPMHISNMLDRIIKAGAPTTASDVLSYSKPIFNHAIKRHIIKHNPAAAFDKTDAGGTESARERFQSQEEITKLFKAMSESEKFTRHHYLCTKLLLMVGCRKDELFKAKRTDFDLTETIWRMSLENKTKSAITIPLPSQAVAIISELLQFEIDGSEYLLPAQGVRTSKSGYISDSYLNKPIKNWVFPLMADVPNFHIHDLRATMILNLEEK